MNAITRNMNQRVLISIRLAKQQMVEIIILKLTSFVTTAMVIQGFYSITQWQLNHNAKEAPSFTVHCIDAIQVSEI